MLDHKWREDPRFMTTACFTSVGDRCIRSQALVTSRVVHIITLKGLRWANSKEDITF